MVLGILTFVVVIGFGLVLMQPVFAQYVDTYAVRVRPRKEKGDELAQEQPHNDTMLLFLRTVGELVLSVMPGLADKRTVQLLMMGNYRTPAHLAIYTGLKTMVVSVFVFFGLLANVGNVFGILLCVPAAILGWLFPNFFLAARVKKRQNLVLNELPTILDLLVVCAQAGLGLLGDRIVPGSSH
jgi:tight adherence protein C